MKTKNLVLAKANFIVCLLCLTLSPLAFAARTVDGVLWKDTFAPTVTFPSGETTISAYAGTSTTVGGKALENKCGVSGATVDGTVIKPQLANGASRADLYFALMVTNGTATLDLTDLGDAPFAYQGGIWVEAPGKLVVKGRDALVFGRTDRSTPSAFPALRTEDAQSLSFVDGNGAAYASPEGIVFTNFFCEVRFPTDVPWKISNGSLAAVYRAVNGPIRTRYVSDNAMTLGTFDLWLIDEEAFAGVALTIPTGHEVKVLPRTLVWEVDVGYNANGNSNPIFDNAIVLNGGTFTHANHYYTEQTGAISGKGTFRYAPPSRMGETTRVTAIRGAATFTGPVEIAPEASPASGLAYSGHVVFHQASPGAAGNPVTIGKYGKLELRPASTATGRIASLAAPTAPAALQLGADLTLELDAAPSDTVTIEGAGADSSTLLRGWSLAENECFVEARTATYLYGLTAAVKADATQVTRPNGLGAYLKTSSSTVDLEPFAELSTLEGQLTLAAESGKAYINMSSNIVVKPAAAASVSVAGLPDRALNFSVAEDATVAVNPPVCDWASAVSARFDFSTALDNYRPCVPDASGTDYVVASNIWYDAAAAEGGGPTGGYFLMCDKSYADTISPVLRSDGPNGKTYLHLYQNSKFRRAPLWSRATGEMAYKNNAIRFKPKFAILVFGSQQGGGAALFGHCGGHGYMRAGLTYGKPTSGYIGNADGTKQLNGYDIPKENGLFANDSIACWLDGQKVATPSEQGLNGDWQVISVDTSAYPVDGFGFVDEPSHAQDCGGQQYADVIFFDRVLTDLERVTVERALAQKWSVSTYVDCGLGTNSVCVAASGKGTVSLNADAKLLPGAFRGSIDLNGKVLTLDACALPPTEAVVSNSVMPRSWFDPSRETLLNTTQMASMEGVKIVNMMYDVISNNATGASYLSSRGRSPALVPAARADGPELNWIDYSPYAKVKAMPGTVNGPSLRCKTFGPDSETGYSLEPITAQTVVMVQDSSKGGGTPFMDTLAGSAFSQRDPQYDTYGAISSADPIWKGNTVSIFSSGQTRLDGNEVDGSIAGFGGGPEILTAQADASFALGAFGNLYYLENHKPNDIDQGAIQGEILVYNQVLESALLKDVEAYLAWKWLGRAINGYGTTTELTVGGTSGTLVVPTLGQLPKFDAAFSGTVDLTAVASIDCTLGENGAVSGGLTCPGTVQFPAAATLNVTFAARQHPGQYTLLAANGGLNQTTWSLNATGFNADRAVLAVTEKSVVLVVKPRGTLMLIK